MRVPIDWIRDYVDITASASILGHRLTMAGVEVGRVMASEAGEVLDLEVTPNRPDCLSLLGVAQEIAALSGGEVKWPSAEYLEGREDIGSFVQVTIGDEDLCFRYSASLIKGVKVGPSPLWMQQRLLAAGMRPINNVVDATNYIMMEWGQPLHAFDYRNIRGKQVVIRRARDGESLKLIDGTLVKLEPEMLVIADGEAPVALAGVMGGLETEVGDETQDVLLESANFYHINIRRTCHRLHLRTEASLRFEKGISPDLTVPALRRATGLVQELGGGEVLRGTADLYPHPLPAKEIHISQNDCRRILGVDWSIAEIEDALTALSFRCVKLDAQVLSVTPPFMRMDIGLKEDIVEEVARIKGYDEIPTTLPEGQLPLPVHDPLRSLEESVRNILAGYGLQELITYSFVSRELVDRVSTDLADQAIRLANPMSREQELLRPTMRASLLTALAANARFGGEGLGFFEIGKAYLSRVGELPEEQKTLAVVLGGPARERSWLTPPLDADFFMAKGLVNGLLGWLRIQASFSPTVDDFFHPGKRASILVKDEEVGSIGEVHPLVLGRFDIPLARVCFCEIQLAKLFPFSLAIPRFQPLNRFPGVAQDLAVVVDDGVPVITVQNIIQESLLVSRVVLFDVYKGVPIAPGKKSLAFSILYQSPERTLTDQEAAEAQQELMERLGRLVGANFRT
ncbi:MAG: phenylalanine--tRNA ligase subunit beta [Chloroflexi bacterium]|nr:phenylalanine--tRNA ligase subunit beta [Chloroflexota bacterium]